MGNISLYRKWRSQTFGDIVSQKHVTRTLCNVIRNPGLISHAYLFCGPRGTGKTSMARIFAKALNCTGKVDMPPCGECPCCRRITDGSSMDVMEIDAASHTSVEMVREYIINKVNFAPVEGRYKIYIIDEVHKLSGSSFNALLKTLEEPPSHVVFILATTNPNDLPATILSRCQKFDFRRISHHDVMGRLRHICEEEGFSITESALSIIASMSSGSLRDAIVLLEQAVSFADGEITAANVSSLLGLSDSGMLFSLAQFIYEGKVQDMLLLVDRVIREGRDVLRLVKDLMEHYRRILLVRVMSDAGPVLDLSEEDMDAYRKAAEMYDSEEALKIADHVKSLFKLASSIKDSSCQRPLLEAVLIRMASKAAPSAEAALSARIARLEKALSSGTPFVPGPLPPPAALSAPPPDAGGSVGEASPEAKPGPDGAGFAAKAAPPQGGQAAPAASSPSSGGGALKAAWPRIMMSLKADKISLHAIMNDPNVSVSFGGDDSISISVKPGYDFHKGQIDKNVGYVRELVSKVTGIKPAVSVSFASSPSSGGGRAAKAAKAPKAPDEILTSRHRDLVKEVMDVFGGRTIQM